MIRRKSETSMNTFYMNVAASIQSVLEEILLEICKYIKKETNMKNLCLSGGVALNCVANGKILKANIFENIWIQPASGDAGGALGAALYLSNKLTNKIKYSSNFMNPYLGPEFSDFEIEKFLKRNNINYKKFDNISLVAAKLLIDGNILGWFQGIAEFGPRALGYRSILGNPLLSSMQKEINLRVKYRESFRPFAPVILEEHKSEWFDINTESPYMLIVSGIAKAKLLDNHNIRKYNLDDLNITRSLIPAVTHVDCSARIQTVSLKTTNFFMH